MIDREERKMAAETYVQDSNPKEDAPTPDRSLPGSKMNTLSLMESEDDEDEDEDDDDDHGEGHSFLLSRNPSLTDADLEYGDSTPRRRSNSVFGEGRDYAAGALEGEWTSTLRSSTIYCEPSHNPLCYPQIPGCQGNLAEQIDLMTQCRHPLDLFSAFHEHTNCKEPSERFLPGMYAIPRHCEYCGASDTDVCGPECQRPKLFFRKKRPPLCPPDGDQWDPATDFEIKEKENPTARAKKDTLEPNVDKQRRSRFVFRDLFH